MAVAALEAGKHVLREKPMSVDIAGAEAMVAAARASGRLLSVNQHMRFDRTTLALRDAVASGALGDVYLADVRMTRQNGIPGYGSWFTNRDLAGHGALFDIGVHMLDLALFVLGFPEVVAVKGYLGARLGESGVGLGTWGIDRGRAGRFDVDDTATATLTLAGGGQIRLHVAWAAFAPAEQRITLRHPRRRRPLRCRGERRSPAAALRQGCRWRDRGPADRPGGCRAAAAGRARSLRSFARCATASRWSCARGDAPDDPDPRAHRRVGGRRQRARPVAGDRLQPVSGVVVSPTFDAICALVWGETSDLTRSARWLVLQQRVSRKAPASPFPEASTS